MEQTDLDYNDIRDEGLDDAFQNWLSTLVDTINSNLDMLEMTINPLIAPEVLHLQRCDTSATSNIAFSQDFQNFLRLLVEKVNQNSSDKGQP